MWEVNFPSIATPTRLQRTFPLICIHPNHTVSQWAPHYTLWSTHAVCHESHGVTSRDNRGECAVPSIVHQFHSYQDHQHRMNALLRQTCAVSIVIKPSATIKPLRQEQQRTEPCIDSQREPANTSNNVLPTASKHDFRASNDTSNILAHTFRPIFCIL